MGKSTLSLRIDEESKNELKRIGNTNITAGIMSLLTEHKSVMTAQEKVPEWYFSAETVSNVTFYNWARTLENNEENAKYIRQFWVIASDKLYGYNGNISLGTFIETMVMDPKSPFYLPMVRDALLPLIEDWKSFMDLDDYRKDLEEDIGMLKATVESLGGVLEDFEDALIDIKDTQNFEAFLKDHNISFDDLKKEFDLAFLHE